MPPMCKVVSGSRHRGSRKTKVPILRNSQFSGENGSTDHFNDDKFYRDAEGVFKCLHSFVLWFIGQL